MDAVQDIEKKRAILLTARIRFSPQLQPVKETAVDKIIEQILFASSSEEGLSSEEVQGVFSAVSGGYRINYSDLRNSLKRLVENNRIIPSSKILDRFVLPEETKKDIGDLHRQAARRFDAVVRKLFKNTGEASVYISPFCKFLSIIFSELGEESVRLIKGDIKGRDLLASPSISSTLDQIRQEFHLIDPILFESAVMTFFQESEPDYDTIKWDMAQNYFITKALGLDPSGALLSKEVFGQSCFYFDTNVLIEALEPRHKHHNSFLAFATACKRLGITLKVCQISLWELDNWLAYQRDLINKVVDQIPEQTAPKIRSIFYEIYLAKKTSGDACQIGELFNSFSSPLDDLKRLFDVQLEDDIWFVEQKERPETSRLAEALRAKYIGLRRHPKGRGAAHHDALLLLWLQKIRNESKRNIWLVTTDTSLPGSVPLNESSTSLAITLDALLQWVSPIATPEGGDEDFTAAFADMLRSRVLPAERFFELEDFLIFHEMHMSCRELPAEDVEECVRYFKQNAPLLNPSDPSDREKLSYQVSKFFADPGRKYTQEITRLETEKQHLKQEYEKKLGDALTQIEELEQKRAKDLEKHERTVGELKRRFTEYEQKGEKQSVKRSAGFRVAVTILAFMILEGLALFLIGKYGDGANFVQKFVNSWVIPAVLVPGATTLLGWFFIGRDRLKALGWPFTKIFKHE